MPQPTTARLDLPVWRNDDVYEFPLRVVGLDLSGDPGVSLAMQVRLGPDTPGAPLIDLTKVTNGNAEGLRVAGVTQLDDLPVSDVRIRINKSTRQALPYAGEMGDATPLSYALLIGGRTRLIGFMNLLAHTYGSNNAPTNRPAGYGSASGAAPAGGATLTISQDGGATLVIDGADLAAGIAEQAKRYAERAEEVVADLAQFETSSATGNAIATSRRRSQLFGGAVPIIDAMGVVGVLTPAGSNGEGSLVQPGLPIDGVALTGSTQRMTIAATRGTPFTRTLVFGDVVSVKLASGQMVDRGANVLKVDDGATTTWSIDFPVTADDRVAFVYVQQTGSTPAPQAERWEVTRLDCRTLGETDENVGARATAVVDAAAAADIAPPADTTLHVENGAVEIRSDDGVGIGWSMAAAPNRSGYDSYLILRETLDPSQAGAIELYEIVAAVSPTFTRNLAREIVIDQVGSGNDDATIDELRFVAFGGFLRWTFQRLVRPGNARLTAILRVTADQSPVAPEYLKVLTVKRRYLTTVDPTRSLSEVNRDRFKQRLLSETAGMIRAGILPTIVTVKADGTGDFAHPADAVAAITDASAIKPYVVQVHPGRYTGKGNWLTKDYVDLVGVDRETCILHWEQPNDASAAELAQSQIFYLNSRTRVANLTLTGRNLRYVIHLDDNNARNVDSLVVIENVTLIHYGNDQAVNADPATALVPFGCGVNSGMLLLIDNVDAIGPAGGGLAFHNNVGSTFAAKVKIANSRSIALTPGRFATFTSLGSRRADTVDLEGCDYGGGIHMTCPAWPSVPVSDLPADRCEIEITGARLQPAAFRVTLDNARALRITSADATAATLVEVDPTSTGAIALFKQVLPIAGGAGLPAAVRSWLDVSGEVNGSLMGQRLGDCSTVNKVLRIRFQGGSWINVTFTYNMGPADNAEVLAVINQQLGAAGTADLWAVTTATRRPRIRDEERSLVNATATAIRKGTALAFAGSSNRARPMTSADPASLFAGIAWQDILPGRAGRVKMAGYLPLEDMLVDGVGLVGEQLAFQDRLGVGTTAGRLVKNAAVPIATVVEAYIPALGLTPSISLRA